MGKPLQEYIQEYLDTIKVNNNWLISEMQKLSKVSDPDLVKAAELMGRSRNLQRETMEMRDHLNHLEKMCKVLGVDPDRLEVDDGLTFH